MKGTGFAIDSGYVITNAHVVEGCEAPDLLVFSATAQVEGVSGLVVDTDRDLAALRFRNKPATGLKIDTRNHRVGVQVSTWGHPLGYDGPPPILTVGYISGFAYQPTPPTKAVPKKAFPVRQIVLNAAVNPGNSGGPLFSSGGLDVIGVIVSKHAPITPFLRSAIEALSTNKSGVLFSATDAQGNTSQLVESQIVAEVLLYFREMTQVVIGQAIAASELATFLSANKIPWTPATARSTPAPRKR